MEAELKIALVTWQDCECISGWHNRDVIDNLISEPMATFKSVGWLYHNGDDCVVLAMSTGDKKAGELLRIPRLMVNDVMVLSGD